MLRSLLHHLKIAAERKSANNVNGLPGSNSILDVYVNKAPSKQNILDIFEGEWSSRLPEAYKLQTVPGFADLFEHSLVHWAEEILGSFSEKRILELGPLEGGHSYMLNKSGAAKVVSIEANTRAFLKCLCVKEVLKMTSVEFRLGDFMLYLEDCDERYDIAFASGVLYHMMDPVKLLHQLSIVADKLLLWTHYYDEKIIMVKDPKHKRFGQTYSTKYEDFSYECVSQSYNDALNWVGFSGGPQTGSVWLTRESLMDALDHFGYTNIQTNFDHEDHPNGPAIGICASK